MADLNRMARPTDGFLFMMDLRTRLKYRPQITTDGLRGLRGGDRLLVRCAGRLGDAPEDLQPATQQDERRYSPAVCTGIDVRVRTGDPRPRARSARQLRRAAEPHHADGDAPIHAADQRTLKEGREPGPRRLAALPLLQLLLSRTRLSRTRTPALRRWRPGLPITSGGWRRSPGCWISLKVCEQSKRPTRGRRCSWRTGSWLRSPTPSPLSEAQALRLTAFPTGSSTR